MKPNHPPTHRGIAAATGLSVATVSLALRHHPRISATTRARVEEAAAAVGYHANGVVQELMSHVRLRKRPAVQALLGALTAFETPGWEGTWFVRRAIASATARAEHRGYRLDVFRINTPGLSATRLHQILTSRNIRALVILPIELRADHAPAVNLAEFPFDWSSFAVAKFGFSTREPAFHTAVNYQRHTLELGCRKLVELGYCRIGLANPELNDHVVDHGWSGGFRIFQVSVPRAQRTPPFLPPLSRWNKAEFLKWLQRWQPDAVISNHHDPYCWLLEEGYAMPRDIGYLRLDRDPTRPVACVDQHSEEVAAATVDLAIDQLHRSDFGIPAIQRIVMVEAGWIGGPTVERRSCGMLAPNLCAEQQS